jgi:PPOX class probable F420-dependent enzyme
MAASIEVGQAAGQHSRLRFVLRSDRLPALDEPQDWDKSGLVSKHLCEDKPASMPLSDPERRFLAQQRVGHLATADRGAVPHVVPVCFAIEGDALYITVDEKPKRSGGTTLKRLRNIAENPAVTVIVDRYDENWEKLGWVMLRGCAEILTQGSEHDDAQALLRSRYPQLQSMQFAHHPVIAIRIERTISWGNLSALV